MNERIRELAEQCKERTATNEWPDEYWVHFNEQKFAELIVQECMTNLYLNGYDDAMIQIKQHFGIEL